jgi:hypothetical protein
LTQFANILGISIGRDAERLMGTPINTPLTSEIWHLTIDDLLEPLPASPRLGGPGPFVINLSASTAPISVPMKAVAEHPGTHVYQIQRTEDRRVRYRLRLGPFETEAEAEALLSTVREIYPSALTASAEAEDLRSIEAIKNKIEAQQLAAVKAAMSKAAAASLPNGRPGLARAAAPEAAERPPGAATDGEALPTSPPPAWLALRTPKPKPAEQPVELDVPAPAAKPSPKPPPASVKAAAPAPAKSARGFAPARWSAAARAFVPSADFASAAASASTAATAPASPATTAAPARPDVPTVSVVPESLIPVLSDSVAVPRSMPASRPAASPIPAPKVSGPAPANSPAPAVVTSAGSTAPPLAAPAPVAAAPPVVITPPPAMAPAVIAAPPVATVPPAVIATPVTPPPAFVTARPVTSAPGGVSAFAAPSGAIPARQAPAPALSSRAPAPRMMPGPRTATAAPRTEAKDARVASFDTTQTLRPLTPTELQDAASLRWFVIQLSCSEEVFDPDALPNLDIFSEYRLYSVASLEQGKTLHSLRVGFFSEESHAKAVAGYLGTFYNEPTVKRISAAERTRFAQHRVEARKDIGATGKHAVIEITDERVIRPKRAGNTSVSPMCPPLPTPPSVRGR